MIHAAGLFLLIALWCGVSVGAEAERWAVYYGPARDARDFAPFDLVALEDGTKPPVAELKRSGKKVLAYMSVCEISADRSFAAEARRRGLFLGRNAVWRDNSFVNVASPWWKEMLTRRLPDGLVARGYDGFMLDTIDSCIELARKSPRLYGGFGREVREILRALRQNFPDAIIMVNRGFEWLPDLAPFMDALLAESTLTDYDFRLKRAFWLSSEDKEWGLAYIRAAREANPSLKVYSVDYWPLDDRASLEKIYETQRANGFVPYVATVDLTRLGPAL